MLFDTTGLYFVRNRSTTAEVIRLSTGEFQVWVPGNLGSLLRADHILAVPPLAERLVALCGDDLRMRPTRVLRRATNEAWPYCELMPFTEIAIPDDVSAALASSVRVWRCGRYLLVHNTIKQKLNALDFPDLVFDPNLRQLINFGGP